MPENPGQASNDNDPDCEMVIRSTTRRWSTPLLLLILALAALVQFTVVARSRSEMPMVSDAADYFSYAYNLKHFGIYSNALTWAGEPPPGGVQPDALRSPGYPLFLLAIPGLDASDAYLHQVALVQATFGVLSVWLVFLVGGHFLRPGWSHLAAFITAISPHLANLDTYLLTETLFHFLLLLSVQASILALSRPGKWMPLLAGLAWGLCSLVRPTVMFVPALLLLCTIAVPAMRKWHLAAFWVFAGFLAVQTPWLLRNQVSSPDRSQGSLMVGTLHHGSYPDFMYQNRPETLGWPFRYDPRSEQAERDLPSALSDIAGKFRAQPLAYAKWYLLGKPGTFLSWGYIQGHDIYVFEPLQSPYLDNPWFAVSRTLAFWLHWPMMLLGSIAALLAWWRPTWLGLEGDRLLAARLVSLVILYAIAFHMLAAPYPRYGVPFRSLIQVMALASASTWISRRSLRP